MTQSRPLVAFVLEQVLGHVSQAQMLKRHVPEVAGFEPTFADVTFHREGGLVEKLPAPRAARASLRARLEVRQSLAKRRPDAVFWNTQKPALFCPDYLRLAPSIFSLDVTPVQYDALGDHYDHVPDGDGIVARMKHRWNRSIFHMAKRILPASQWAAQSVINDYDVPPERIRVIPPGVDTERWFPAQQRPDGGPIRILFVGGHFERKGGPMLLDWVRSSPAARSCELHVVTRTKVPPAERVHVHRMANNSDELTRLAQSCDFFALPTKGDCFSLASLEAMAAGLPVVVNGVGGIPDIFEDGTAGFMLEPGDTAAFGRAMNALASDAVLRRRMGAAARQRVEERFDARKNVSEVVEEIEQLLDERAVTDRRSQPQSREHSARA